MFKKGIVLLLLAMVLVACQGQPAQTPSQVPQVEPTRPAATPEATATSAPTPTQDPLAAFAPDAVEGNIIIAGSSTVYPLTERIAELFQQEGFDGQITVDSIGTGAGFERFCKAGETDIANASRPIKDSEREQCQSIGRDPLESRVGTDALAVVVSPDNDFVTSLTLDQLAQIFSGQVRKWNEVDPAFPDQPIRVFSPGSDSGTFDYFIEEVVVRALPKTADGKADIQGAKAALLNLEGVQLSEDDNVLLQGVSGDKYAIGYFGFAYYYENPDKVKPVQVNGVAPSKETVDNGTYPLARPLFIYSDANLMREKPQVGAFILFYMQHVNEVIGDVGYFPAPEADYQAALDRVYEALGLK